MIFPGWVSIRIDANTITRMNKTVAELFALYMEGEETPVSGDRMAEWNNLHA